MIGIVEKRGRERIAKKIYRANGREMYFTERRAGLFQMWTTYLVDMPIEYDSKIKQPAKSGIFHTHESAAQALWPDS